MRLAGKTLLMAIWACGLLGLRAQAQDTGTVIANMRACAAEKEDARRLACYDKQFGQSGLTAAPAVDQFGLTEGQILRKESNGAPPAAVKQITGRIVNLSQVRGGHLVLRLDNGQVWEQTEAGPDLKIDAGDAVQIDRGVLGAYWLSKPAGHLAIKVRRAE